MNKLFNYLKSYLLFLIILILYLLVITIFYYFEIFNYKILNIINYVLILVLFFHLGYKISNLEKNKGYLNGFLISLILIIIFMIITLVWSKITFSNIVYYFSLIVSSMIGGILGVNKK